MGLDWLLKPKVEHGTEVSALEELGAIRLGGDDPRAVDAFRRIFDSHQETAAERLARDPTDAYGRRWRRPFEEVLAEAVNDRPVLVNTLPDPLPEELAAGLPSFGASPFCGPVDFRGKAVAYCRCLPGDLADRAYSDLDPPEMVQYAAELEAVIADPLCGADADERSILQAAIKWLRFWGGRGFGLSAWY